MEGTELFSLIQEKSESHLLAYYALSDIGPPENTMANPRPRYTHRRDPMPTSCWWYKEYFGRAELSKIFHRVEELKANRARKRVVIDSKSEAKTIIVNTCFPLFDFLGV